MDIINKIDKKLYEWIGGQEGEENIALMIDEIRSNLEELESSMKKIKDSKGLKQLKAVKREVSKL